MKVLIFSDVHGSLSCFEKIKKKSEKADLLICAGDVSIFEQGLDYIMELLNKLGKPVIMIPGNHESEAAMDSACKNNANMIHLHKGVYVKDNYIFVGYGGGGFSSVDRAFDAIAKPILAAVAKERKNVKENLGKDAKLVLITHAPPHGTKVDVIYGDHCGNKSIRNFILKAKPHIVVCGHLHENAGVDDVLGGSYVINPGPSGVLIDL